MRRECRQALFDALLIAYIHIQFIKHTDNAVFACRYHHTAHCHKHKQACGFERNRLTAGVRTGHDQQAEILAEPYVDRNDLFRIE